MTTIFDIPDEILVKIIRFLTPKERLPLSKSCTKFNGLVFEDEESLKYLNFSKSGHSMLDVNEYFDNEITCKLIRGLNLQNAIIADRFLETYIAKAMNLVDINLHGREMNIQRLETLLNPLQHVKRLSFDWRETGNIVFLFDQSVILKQRFGGLIYLSVHIMVNHLHLLISLLKMCKELKELYIVASYQKVQNNPPALPEEFPLPRSTKIVDYGGNMALRVQQMIRKVLSNPEEWTDFRMELYRADEDGKFHMEKNVQICDELLDHGTIRCARYNPAKNPCNVGRVITPADLLRKVVITRHQNPPTEFCCLFESDFLGRSCMMTIKDAKGLLKDSGYQLTSLRLCHEVEVNCDVHLITSVFPSLTDLHLSGILLKESTKVERNFEERLMREGDATPQLEPRDSSFKTVVGNTPRLRRFAMIARGSNNSSWDFDGLGLISSWKSLETLVLSIKSFGDGRFLSEIAKQCEYLKIIRFVDRNYNFDLHLVHEELFLDMLASCKNLREFSLRGYALSKPTKMFNLLHNYPLMETIDLAFITCDDTPDNVIRSIEQLLDRCSKLTRLYLRFKDGDKELVNAFQRSNGERIHRNIEISVDDDFFNLIRGQIMMSIMPE